MIITMHGLSTMHSNMRTDIRIAGQVGYDGLEMVESKLLRYLDLGFKAKELVPLFQAATTLVAPVDRADVVVPPFGVSPFAAADRWGPPARQGQANGDANN